MIDSLKTCLEIVLLLSSVGLGMGIAVKIVLLLLPKGNKND